MEYLTTICGSICSNKAQSGGYAYQAFKKVPSISGFAGVFKQLTQLTGMSSNRNLISMQNLIGIKNAFSSSSKGQDIGGFDISQFLQNLPVNSVKAQQSNLKKLIPEEDLVIKKIKKSNYDDLIKKHSQSKQLFTDLQFPPNSTSIGKAQGVDPNVTWKRIPEVIQRPQFISGVVQPSDILQGGLGDCYFLSAIAALSQNDFRIKNLFASLEINPYGIYMARILYKGILHQVVVDDYIPVNSKGQFLFAKPSGGKQIWVVILEKCWAKIHKNYGEIIGGLPNQVLHAFSGAPTYYRSVPKTKQKQDALWAQILDLQKNGGILCCGTKGDALIEKAGLVKGHAYTILGVFQSPEKILKIRNPWGSKEWNGRLSEQDTQFWSNVKAADLTKMGYTKKNDGTFFMLWEDFLNYFNMIDICKINDNSHYINCDSKFQKKNGEVFQFDTDGGLLTIGLSQQSLRSQSQNVEQEGYARSTLVVGRIVQNGYEYVNSSSFRVFADHYLQLPALKKGKYVVFAKFDWILKNPDDGTLSVYTTSSTVLRKSKQTQHPKFLQKVFENRAKTSSKRKSINNNSAWLTNQFLFSQGGYGFIYLQVEKISQKSLGLQIDEKQFQDKKMILKKPYKNSGNKKIILKPGQSCIILYRLKLLNYPTSLSIPNPKITVESI